MGVQRNSLQKPDELSPENHCGLIRKMFYDELPKSTYFASEVL
jgi:hypothetical protein